MSGDSKTGSQSLGETLKTLVWAVAVALLIRSFLYEPFNIPSGSMTPTLLTGDYMFVSKFAYGYSRYSFPFAPPLFSGRLAGSLPERGDVAVFRHPADTSMDYVKRVIGLPGDQVQMRGGRLYINGTAVPRQPLAAYPDPAGVRLPALRYLESLPGGRSHEILETAGDNGAYDNTPEYTVPPGHLFMMGDNRDNSNDSRVNVGMVPVENLVGRASFLFFSVDGSASLWRPWTWPGGIRYSRLLNGIH